MGGLPDDDALGTPARSRREDAVAVVRVHRHRAWNRKAGRGRRRDVGTGLQLLDKIHRHLTFEGNVQDDRNGPGKARCDLRDHQFLTQRQVEDPSSSVSPEASPELGGADQ